MKLSGSFGLLPVAFALVLAGCGSSPDPAAEKACLVLASAENGLNNALAAYVRDGMPEAGKSAMNKARADYPLIAGDAADVAPSEMKVGLLEVQRSGQAFVDSEWSADAAPAFGDAKTAALQACEDAGVDLRITNPRTGVVE